MTPAFHHGGPVRAGIDARERHRQQIVALLWVYFALLMAEGALRKWVLPEWSDPLLVARDPVAAAILALAVQGRFLVFSKPARAFVALTVLFVALAAAQVATGDAVSIPVLLFGLRTYCLHPPVIFVMARVLTAHDLRRMGIAVLVLMTPIAVLMIEQFRSAPTDWINVGAGQGSTQIRSALGHIRPPGPFSFISGPVLFYALGLACLLAIQFESSPSLIPVCVAAWAALVAAAAVSGSRSFVGAMGPVLACAAASAALRPQIAGRFARGAVIAALMAAFAWSTATVQDGVGVFSARLIEAGDTENLFTRTFGSYTDAIAAVQIAPLFGYGLGLGTNAGNAWLGTTVFRLGEDEWTRVILEAGSLFGLAYLLWRAWLTWWLTRMSVRAASRGYVLPLLCVGASVTNLISGNWGQATSLGFAVWTAGMSAAASRVAFESAALQGRRQARARRTVDELPRAAAHTVAATR